MRCVCCYILLVLQRSESARPWTHISPLLLNEPPEYLPAVPPLELAAAVYGPVAHTHSEGHPFAS
eukprot:6891709-Prymnesium_polylepis.2